MDDGSVGRAQFLTRIRQALNRPAGRILGSGPGGSVGAEERTRDVGRDSCDPADPQALVTQLRQAASTVDLRVSVHGDNRQAAGHVADRVVGLAGKEAPGLKIAAWSHPLLAALDLHRRLRDEAVEVRSIAAGREREEETRCWLAESRVGITSADWVLADTATLVCRSRPGRPRAVFLLPEIHIAVTTVDRLLPDLKTLYRRLQGSDGEPGRGLGHCTTLITGPSRTRDIEGIMVFGAHGPREVHLVVIEGTWNVQR